MQFLTEWISNIILFILLATILELLLPNSSLQKYVKMVIGLLLLVMILNPLFSIFIKDEQSWINVLNHIPDQINESEIENSIENKKKEIQQAQLAYISKQVAVQLKVQVEEEMMEKFGQEITSINIQLSDLFTEEEDYFNSIHGVTIYTKPVTSTVTNDFDSIEAIALVNVDTTKRDMKDVENSKENQEIIRYLESRWPIPTEKIHLVMEGG